MLTDPPSRKVQSVRTAFRLLNAIQELGGATPAQLTEQFDLSKSSVHNYLATLEMDGYVAREDGTYRLGLRFLTHGTAAKNTLDLRYPTADVVQSLAEELSHPTWWVIEESGRGFFIDGSVPEGTASPYGSVGKRSYLHTHGPGLAILAQSENEYVERVVAHHGLPAQTARTTTNESELFETLDRVRERGFAVSDGEAVLGILSVGAGFRDERGRTHALGICGHTRDFTGSKPKAVGERLVRAVRALEAGEWNGGK